MSAMNEKDYYKILGVDENASSDEIRKVFQKKARTLHPDVNKEPDAEQKFKEVSEAYAILSDPEKRKRYDMQRRYPQAGSSAYTGAQAWQDPFSVYAQDPFVWATQAQTRANPSTSYHKEAGSNVVISLNLTPKEAQKGCTKTIRYQHYVACDTCHGTGSALEHAKKTCPTCSGKGHISFDLGGLFMFGMGGMQVVCPECQGSGFIVADPCQDCSGTGRILTKEEVKVTIDPHAQDGQQIRIPNKGNAGTNGAHAGDFVCEVAIPAERLEPAQALGFKLIGIALPLLIFAYMQHILASLGVIVAVPLLLGVIMSFSHGIQSHALRWYKKAFFSFLSGVFSACIIIIFIMAVIWLAQGFSAALR